MLSQQAQPAHPSRPGLVLPSGFPPSLLPCLLQLPWLLSHLLAKFSSASESLHFELPPTYTEHCRHVLTGSSCPAGAALSVTMQASRLHLAALPSSSTCFIPLQHLPVSPTCICFHLPQAVSSWRAGTTWVLSAPPSGLVGPLLRVGAGGTAAE